MNLVLTMGLLLLGCQVAQTDLQKTNSNNQKDDPLVKVISRYSGKSSVRLKLNKTSTLKMLNRSESQSGTAYIQGASKFRIEYEEPQKTIAVISGKKGWLVEYPPKDFDDKVRVTKFSIETKTGKDQLFLTSLLSSGTLLKNFEVTKKQDDHESMSYLLTPKKTNQEVKNVSLVIDTKSETIRQLSYVDPLDNETKFDFLKSEFKVKLDKKLFELQIPKGAEVNEF